VLPRPVEFDVDTLDCLVTGSDLGLVPPCLLGEPAWRDDAEEHVRADAARADAGRLGLLDSARLTPDAERALRALTRPELAMFGGFSVPGSTELSGVFVGVAGREATAAVRVGERVWLCSVQAQTPAEALVARLPAMPPGRGEPVHVRAADVEAAQRRDSFVVGTIADDPPDLRRYRHLLAATPGGGGAPRATRRPDGTQSRYAAAGVLPRCSGWAMARARRDRPRSALDQPAPGAPGADRRRALHRAPEPPSITRHAPGLTGAVTALSVLGVAITRATTDLGSGGTVGGADPSNRLARAMKGDRR
jgi:hypothetical protein